MLKRLSDNIRECFERAAEAKLLADATNDPALKAEYLNAERRWLILARSFGFSERLEDFTAASSEWRQKLEERLQQSNPGVVEADKNHDWPEDILQLHDVADSGGQA